MDIGNGQLIKDGTQVNFSGGVLEIICIPPVLTWKQKIVFWLMRKTDILMNKHASLLREWAPIATITVTVGVDCNGQLVVNF